MRRIVIVLMAGFMANSEVEAAGIVMTDNLNVDGSVAATSFSGDGSGLTNIPGSALSNTSITVNQIANNAVTPAKIAFYDRVAIVATSGGDYNNPATAMSEYATWCRTLSATKPCLLKIMPGVYNVGSSSVVMQHYIDIEGSGEKITKITGINDTGTVLGESNAEIRFITIENTTTGSNARAIYNGLKSPSILHVTATASGGDYSQGVYNSNSSPTMVHVTAKSSGVTLSYGVYNTFSSPVMTNVTATASGGGSNYGVFNAYSSPVMTNLTATASGGTYSFGVLNSLNSTVKIYNSVIKGDDGAFLIDANNAITRVSNSQLEGGVYNHVSAILTCVGAYDGSFVALGTDCQ
jgi:hypothetical protein